MNPRSSYDDDGVGRYGAETGQGATLRYDVIFLDADTKEISAFTMSHSNGSWHAPHATSRLMAAL